MKKLSKYLNYLIIAILSVYGIVYLYQHQYAVAQKDQASLKSLNKAPDVDQIVNKFMRQTAAQTIQDQYASQMAIKKQLVRPLNLTRSENDIHPDDIPLEKQVHRNEVGESPAEMIRQELYEKELQSKGEQQDRQEYARQYIENARRSGYHLVLSEDLKVISATPIRQPSQHDDSVDSYPAD